MKIQRLIVFVLSGVLLAFTLTGCSLGGKTPEQVMADYVKLINDGDYPKAMKLVKDGSGIPTDQIVKVSSSVIPSPVYVEGAPKDNQDSATLVFTVGSGDHHEFGFVKDSEGWKLSEPAFLEDYDLSTDWNKQITPLSQIGKVSVQTSNGVELLEKGYVINNMVDSLADIPLKVSTDGSIGGFGEQNFEAKATLIDEPSLLVKFEKLQLGMGATTAIENLIKETSLYSTYFKGVRDRVQTLQKQPGLRINDRGCSILYDSPYLEMTEVSGTAVKFNDGSLVFACYTLFSDRTDTGAPVVTEEPASMSGGCFNYHTVPVNNLTTELKTTFTVKDSTLTLLWESQDSPTLQPASVVPTSGTCGKVSTLPVGQIIGGLAPSQSPTKGTVLSTSLK